MAVVTMQWVLFGFSLTFSENGSPFIGTFEYGALAKIGSSALPLTAPAVPGVVFVLYQLMFAAITPSIIFGSIAERIKLMPSLIFIFIWSSLVYDFTAYWTWGARGWLRNLACLNSLGLESTPCFSGAIDFAGGGPVHIASGFAGLAFCLFLGKRDKISSTRPHNLTMVFLGTVLIWFGWFAFNGGSAISSTPRAAMAALVSSISASFAGLSWSLLDYFQTKKMSIVSFCSGVIAGLVTITPAAGFVSPWAAIIIGIIGGSGCNLSIRTKEWMGYDDALDAFGLHGVGGLIGAVLTGIFHQSYIPLMDGTITKGGVIEGNWIGLGYQIAAASSVAAYSFGMTYLILLIMSLVPGVEFHGSDHHEQAGFDLVEMGETAYAYAKASDDTSFILPSDTN